ncbi:MAG: nuclear transport factor 2 family protein [Cyclobacteriaceae bacterium]
MSTQEVAEKLVEYCNTGQYEKAQRELFADHCVSIEPEGAPNQITKGKEAILAKGKAFEDMVEKFHSATSSAPIVAENFFSCIQTFDADFKGVGRISMEEISVFEVVNGKIVKEQFFYTPAPMPQG